MMSFVCRGNWWGHAPYKHGSPCSACPPSYGGGCRDNLCYKGRLLFWCKINWLLFTFLFCRAYNMWCGSCSSSENGVQRRPAPELEETNYIEPEPQPEPRAQEPRARPLPPTPSSNDNVERNELVSTVQMCKNWSLIWLHCISYTMSLYSRTCLSPDR